MDLGHHGKVFLAIFVDVKVTLIIDVTLRHQCISGCHRLLQLGGALAQDLWVVLIHLLIVFVCIKRLQFIVANRLLILDAQTLYSYDQFDLLVQYIVEVLVSVRFCVAEEFLPKVVGIAVQ